MKIIVADDHPLVLEGVRTVLERLAPGVTVIEARDYPDLLGRLEGSDDLDLVILDLAMPGMERLDGLDAVQDAVPEVPVVVLSGSEDRDTVRRAMERGAAGYVLKSTGSEVMLKALATVLEGGTWLPMPIEDLAMPDGGHANFPPSAPPAELEARFGAAALNRLPAGVIILDAQARVLFMNRCAESILGQGDGLEVNGHGVCHAAVATETRQLHALVDAAANNCATSESGALSISRPSMNRPLSVMVAPLDGGTSAAMVFVADPEQQRNISAGVLSRLYDLTETEARVVKGLVEGLRLEEVAESFGVSMNTVRSHLKQIFRKTGTNRQAELVRLVVTGSAMVSGEDSPPSQGAAAARTAQRMA